MNHAPGCDVRHRRLGREGVRRVGGRQAHPGQRVPKYAGDIEGESVLEYLMSYGADGSVAYVGIERVTGAVGGRSGSLVLRHIGTFTDGAAKSELTVVGGSGDFEGAAGAGSMVADP